MGRLRQRGRKFITAVSLFLCVLFLLSSVMTSLAWSDFTQTKTNIFRGTADNVTVVLQLVEKDANGVITANPIRPIMNADFQLYRIEDDGSETLVSGGPWYTDINGRIVFDGRDEAHPKLECGQYVFVEIRPAFGYTYDRDENDDNITRYEFEVTQADTSVGGTVTVPAYNRRGSGTLSVRKTVAGNAPADAAFTFTVTFSDNGTHDYSVNGGEEKSVASGGTLTLKHGQTALFEDIPIGVQYRVVEAAHPDYVISSSGHQGSITEAGSVAAFVNTYAPGESGSITVTKEVTGDGADTDKAFAFTAVIGGKTENFSLTAGDSKVFENLPVGTVYSVTEEDYTADGYLAAVREYTGTVTDADGTVLPFVNVRHDPTDTDPGRLTVTKEVNGTGADPNKTFGFEVVFAGEGAPQSPQSFTLKDGESRSFSDIPAGVSYTVRETDPSGYEPQLSVATGVIAAGETATVVFRNQVPAQTVKLSVTKKLAGEYPSADADKVFSFTLIIDGERLSFTLKPDEVKEFVLPQGAQYEIVEADYFAEGYDSSVFNGFGTAGGGEIEAIVTNTFIGDPVVDIEGEKTWVLGGNTDVILPQSITVRLKNGDTVVMEKTVTPDANDDWTYRFTVPKYDADGKRIRYTVEESAIPCFTPTYSGYDITNTYVEPVTGDPPVVTKVVEGENAPDTRFAFVMKGRDGAPMPEGAVEDTKTIYITGGGEVEFGDIAFTNAGVYTYDIYETDTGEAGWTYDTVKYTLTFTVTQQGGRLVIADRSIEQNGEDAQELRFTNLYTEPPSKTVTVQGRKIWNHGANPVEDRPGSILLYVYADGELVVQWQLGEQEDWSYSFELPKYAADGREIVYTVDEEAVDGYTKQINGYDLVNTYVGPSAPDDPAAPSDPGTSPDTGDNSNVVFWFTLMILSLVGLIVTTVLGRKTYAYAGKHCKRSGRGR